MELETIEEVLDVAIAAEELAAATYRSLAEWATHDDLRSLLSDMAAQEEAHRRALERVREGDLTLFAKEAPPVEVLWAPCTAPNVGPLSSPATALLAAIDSERQAFQLYANLARATDDPGLTTLLDALAREEASHWHDLVTAYNQILESEDLQIQDGQPATTSSEDISSHTR